MTQSVQSGTKWLTRTESAARCRVSVATFDKLRRDGSIPEPDSQMGKHMLWKEQTIDDLLESGGTKDDE